MDRISISLKNKRVVFWEEIARDGAQAKTLLNAEQRIEIAQMHGDMFGNNGPDHLVFATGFTSIGKEEREIIRKVADNVDNCWLAVNCRSNEKEIGQSYDVIKKAEYGRIAFVLPVSERLCSLMLHKTQKEVMQRGLEIADYALDKAQGIPIDVQLAGAFNADASFVSDIASAFTEKGIATVGMGDTGGRIYPKETERYLKKITKKADNDVLFSVHFHDDMGFSLPNNLIALRNGIMMPSVSWLGLAERNGLLRTELLTFHLAYEPEKIKERLCIEGKNLFISSPNLKMLPKIAEKVSKYTRVQMKTTDPIVGPGVNSISTGTPFVDPISFQPFDPEKVLGIKREIYVTHLASRRVIKEVADRYGFTLNDKQIYEVLYEIKAEIYKSGKAIMPENKVKEILKKYSE